MSTNILEMMMSSVGGDFATQASKFLGASEGMTKAAMGTVFPSLLGAVMQQGSTPAGATSLMNAMNSPSIGTDLGASMTKMFSGGPAANELMTLGTNLVKGYSATSLARSPKPPRRRADSEVARSKKCSPWVRRFCSGSSRIRSRQASSIRTVS